MTADTFAIACVEELRANLRRDGSASKVAAIIIEPMQGTAGNVIPSDRFCRAVRVPSRRKSARS